MKTFAFLSLVACLAFSLFAMPGCQDEDRSEADPKQAELQQGPHEAQDRPASEPAEPAALPASFASAVRFDFGPKGIENLLLDTPVFSNLDRPEQVRFEMTSIRGDSARGLKPFYLSKTEVTAEMFYPWATGSGLVGDAWKRWAALDLHPSQIARDVLQYGPANRPAMGMSRSAAELYCAWLSRETGRAYRLPTEAEWAHALRLGGGVSRDRAVLLSRASLKDNAQGMNDPPYLELPSAVGSRKPDALGLHDMLGNATEWVTDTAQTRVVRGGHFMVAADELTDGWRWVEDLSAWNASYPNYPQSEYWYHDFYYTGIRLACDADQAPALNSTPKPKTNATIDK